MIIIQVSCFNAKDILNTGVSFVSLCSSLVAYHNFNMFQQDLETSPGLCPVINRSCAELTKYDCIC